MFVDGDRDIASRGAAFADGRSGVGSARWFRALTSRKQTGTSHIRNYKLDGLRTVGPLRLIVLQDRSGSMEPFASAREAMLEQLFAWAPMTLGAGDELAIVDFSDHAGTALDPTAVERLRVADVKEGCGSGGTLINPAMYAALPFIDESRTNWVIAISDGEIFDTVTDQIALLIKEPHYGGTVLVNPAYADVPRSWADSFPESKAVQMIGLDAGGVAVSIGHALAAATGQRLVRGRAPRAVSMKSRLRGAGRRP